MGTDFRETLKKGSSGESVTFWTVFLHYQNLLNTTTDLFDDEVDAATKKFQAQHGLVADGIVGHITWGFTASFKDPAPNLIKTESDLLKWIHGNLGRYIVEAIKDTSWTEDILGAMAARETGFLIAKNVNKGKMPEEIAALMTGDFTNGQYHGFSFWQIDIRSFPDFIKSGQWKDIQASANKAVEVLEGKKKYLVAHFPDMDLTRAVIAAYNTGEGNVRKSIEAGRDVDATTAHGNYSADVMRMSEIFKRVNI